MSLLEALILGILQGLTEFLPVSSSGHLELGKAILGDNSLPEESLLFTVVVHFATALATIVVFRKDIADLIMGMFRSGDNEEIRYFVKIGISMIPATVIGLAFEEEIAMLFGGRIMLVGMMLILTGLLLFLADRASRTNNSVGYLDSLIIGISQAIAIIPGISRSGATISTSVLLRIDRTRAARFSFLMVVPLIFGKIAKDLIDLDFAAYNADKLSILGVGFLAAFISGLVACTWMIRLVQKAKLRYFSIYCFLVGALAIGITYYLEN